MTPDLAMAIAELHDAGENLVEYLRAHPEVLGPGVAELVIADIERGNSDLRAALESPPDDEPLP